MLSIRTYTMLIFEVATLFVYSTYSQPYFEHPPSYHLYSSFLLSCIAPSPTNYTANTPLLLIYPLTPLSQLRIGDVGQRTTSFPRGHSRPTQRFVVHLWVASPFSQTPPLTPLPPLHNLSHRRTQPVRPLSKLKNRPRNCLPPPHYIAW